MKLRWLWIILLVLMIMVVCGLIVSVLGIGLYSFTSVSTNTESIGSAFDRVLNSQGVTIPSTGVESVEDRTFQVGQDNFTLVVENLIGNVSVQGKDTDEIFMSGRKTAWGFSGEESMDNLELLKYEVIEEPGKLTIRVLQPSKNLNRPGKIDFKIDVPHDTLIYLKTNNGDLFAANIQGNVEMENSFGSIEVRDMQDGALKVKNTNGKITLRGINIVDFPMRVTNEFGDVNIYQANTNELFVSITNGNVNLENIMVSGDIDLSNNFGNVDYLSGQGKKLTVKSLNGTITLRGIKVDEKLVAGTDFGNLKLSDTLAADYDLSTKNGRIDLDGAESAKIKSVTDFGDIEMVNIKDSIVEIETKNGTIKLNGSLAEGDHRIKSEFGNISVRLPASTSINCDIKTNFGKITSEFDLTVSGSIDEKHLVGKINDGGGLLIIETQNGNINLEKSTTEVK
ncbi:MAG TPA: DUF4097 family beta strand repeat-containing protein [Anaerolineaceae bacterium]|nr:DUF4097 family beta strand repeat-containing protein [Anaerolineaceae bacterium]